MSTLNRFQRTNIKKKYSIATAYYLKGKNQAKSKKLSKEDKIALSFGKLGDVMKAYKELKQLD